MFNCFDVVSFLLEECSGIDVNVTTDDDYLYTPLHLAYTYGHTQIAQYLDTTRCMRRCACYNDGYSYTISVY